MTSQKYKMAALISLAMVGLSLLPDINLWAIRGRQWNGAFASATGDEVIYSAYVNALISGRSRKNDPYAGRDDTPAAPMPESSFSIQFIPPYAISLPARVLGASAATAMIALIALTGLFASLSLFWFLNAVVKDIRLAAVGTLFVLCMGGLLGGSGLVGVLVGNPLAIPGFPFLRRYQPAAAFPLLFIFNLLVWYGLTNQINRCVRAATVLAGFALATMIFSYFYLWTAAAAWLVSISGVWFCFRPNDRRQVLAIFGGIVAVASVALFPYAYLLSRRSLNIDAMQALVLTHQLDLFWLAEILGLLIVGLIVYLGWRRQIQWDNPQAIFAVSFGLFPLVLFNQQLITGRSLQPHHYAHFIVNYSVAVGIVILVGLLRKTISSRGLIWLGALLFCWGFLEMGLPARFASVPLAKTRDQMVPVFLRLQNSAVNDGTIRGLKSLGRSPALVFSPSIEVNRMLPTWAPQGTLLDMRGLDFGSTSPQERKEFFFIHSYFSGMDSRSMDRALRDLSNDLELNFYARSIMWGYERVIAGLSVQHIAIQPTEVETEIQNYKAFVNSFSREEALKRPITYAIIPADGSFDFTNLDRWYERDVGERYGDYVLYRLKLRP